MHACNTWFLVCNQQSSLAPYMMMGAAAKPCAKGESRTLGAESTCLAELGNKPKKKQILTLVVPRVVTSKVDDRRTVSHIDPTLFGPRAVCTYSLLFFLLPAPSSSCAFLSVSFSQAQGPSSRQCSLPRSQRRWHEISRISTLRPEHRAVRCVRATGQKVLCVTRNLKHPPTACIRASTFASFFFLAPSATTHGQTGRYSSLSPRHFLFFFFYRVCTLVSLAVSWLRN
ncbi:hypothetical protein J3458_002980 [Metarhizium acridum]|uniref:uncharacterized protein n=1 Tax=Metarhizium acridum TaxID=92637 RepID=UPI001C6AA32A|nr:hypothetical protein J3458_002980 [Metarhizium acridum]